MTATLNFRTLFFLTAIVLSSTGCFIDFDDDDGIFGCVRGEGPRVTRTLNLADFDAITLTNSADVYVRQGNDFSVEAEGEANIIDLLDRDVHGGNWTIRFTDCVRSHSSLDIFITLPDLEAVTTTGSGSVRSDNTFRIGDLTLLSTGSGHIELIVEADDINATSTGSGYIRLEGVGDDLDVLLSGSGDFEGFRLEVRTAEVRVTGSGDAEVNVEDSLKAILSGSGDVRYKGQPVITKTITGSGRVINAN
jgi:hypothetical protein